MASLKEMRNRISSVKATQKITKAMQMVAAAKLRRSQDAAEAARPYARRLASVIANEFAEATDKIYVSSLIEIGLLLMMVTLVISLIGRYIMYRMKT